MNRIYMFFALAALIAQGAAAQNQKSTGAQGIMGKVEFLDGNFMPTGQDLKKGQKQSGQVKTVARKILVFSPALSADVGGGAYQDGSFVKATRKPRYTGWSRTNGRYRIVCPEGTYTVLVAEPEGKLFCAAIDGDGRLCTVVVQKGQLTKHNIQINYKAAY